MKNQLIPPPELAPLSMKCLPMAQRIALWGQWVDGSLEIVKAGMRQRIGPGGNVDEAYRQLYARRMDDHDLTMRHLLDELHRREAASAG